MPTTNREMGDLLRRRRRELEDLPPEDEETTIPPLPEADIAVEITAEPEPASEGEGGMTVAAPGEPSTGESFEYEPFLDAPGAWVVYPPGVPCDDAEYRVQMDRPATEADFERMTRALERAGAPTSGPSEIPPGEEQTY